MVTEISERESVAKELCLISQNQMYRESTLIKARDMVKTAKERGVIDRYLNGSTKSVDHIDLHDIAIEIMRGKDD